MPARLYDQRPGGAQRRRAGHDRGGTEPRRRARPAVRRSRFRHLDALGRPKLFRHLERGEAGLGVMRRSAAFLLCAAAALTGAAALAAAPHDGSWAMEVMTE